MNEYEQREQEKNQRAAFDIIMDVVRERNGKAKERGYLIATLLVIIVLQMFVIWGQYNYYSQGTVTTTTTETVEDNSTIEITTDGEGATAEYIEGNQYNDNAVHTEGGDE